jgi:hypothetical protein
MSFEIVHNIEKGVRQLLEAPSDLIGLLQDQGRRVPFAEAGSGHRALFAEYVGDFAHAYHVGDVWWESCVVAQQSLGLGRREAIDAAFDRRLAGPASAPEVVWFFRTYWLAFDRLNLSLAPAERVRPEHALLGWLVEEGHDDYVRLLTCMPYWPIGLDAEGNWC